MHDRRRSVGVGGLQKGGVWSVCIVCVRGVFDIKIIAGIVCCRRRSKQKKKKKEKGHIKKKQRDDRLLLVAHLQLKQQK